MSKKNYNKYICFDRDGTINKEVKYLSKPEDVELYPEVIPALKRLNVAGYGIIVVTNQSGIGRGYYTEEDMHLVNARISNILLEQGVTIEKFYFCPHTPSDGCRCRKPLNGMLSDASVEFGFPKDEITVVGDKICDVELGQSFGGSGVLVRTGHGCEVDLNKEVVEPDYVCEDLLEAVDWILGSK